MTMIPKYSDLQRLTDEELVARYDSAAEHTVVGTDFYLDELSRRGTRRQSETMLQFTRQMRSWTIVIVMLTVINVAFVIWSVLQA